jgi:hypothetical protein
MTTTPCKFVNYWIRVKLVPKRTLFVDEVAFLVWTPPHELKLRCFLCWDSGRNSKYSQ